MLNILKKPKKKITGTSVSGNYVMYNNGSRYLQPKPIEDFNTLPVPTYTTAQRNALTNVKTGTIIKNSSLDVLQSYDGANWVTIKEGLTETEADLIYEPKNPNFLLVGLINQSKNSSITFAEKRPMPNINIAWQHEDIGKYAGVTNLPIRDLYFFVNYLENTDKEIKISVTSPNKFEIQIYNAGILADNVLGDTLIYLELIQ